MEPARINSLLLPFLDHPLDHAALSSISIYVDLLLRWTARINLTAVRDPEQIVTRHFGESLFAARHLFPRAVGDAHAPVGAPGKASGGIQKPSPAASLADVGSGAGFPGLPIKLWAPHVQLTLIESNQKKATFLKEVSRALILTNVNVFSGRAEDLPSASAATVTLRAVERFASILPIAASLVAPGGRLAVLIGRSQREQAQTLLPGLAWSSPISIPVSSSRILLVGKKPESSK